MDFTTQFDIIFYLNFCFSMVPVVRSPIQHDGTKILIRSSFLVAETGYCANETEKYMNESRQSSEQPHEIQEENQKGFSFNIEISIPILSGLAITFFVSLSTCIFVCCCSKKQTINNHLNVTGGNATAKSSNSVG